MDVSDEIRRWRVVPDRLRYWAGVRPDAPFVKCNSNYLSYSEVDAESDALAAGLSEMGIVKGDRVALIMSNRIEYIISIFAIAKLGAIQLPINTFLKGEFLSYQLKDAGAKAVIADRAGVNEVSKVAHQLERLEHVISADPVDDLGADVDRATILSLAALFLPGRKPPDVKIQASDIVAIMYTSGTTGMPKGCMMSHGYYMITTLVWSKSGWLQPGDIIFTAFPLFHASGNIMGLINALQLGLSVCFETQFSASRFMARAAEEKATVALGVGPMGMAILATPVDSNDREHNLRLCMWTPMAPDAQIAFEQRFNTRVTAQAYGQSEVNPVTMGPVDYPEEKRASTGLPVEYLEVALVDDEDNQVDRGVVGEIVVRPREPNVMFSGYWGKPEATLLSSRNYWHHTGDYAIADKDGYYYFVDRKKDAMRRRGENISSFELEKAIIQHERIRAVAVHAVPSPLGEDDIKACVVLTPGEALDPKELFQWFAEYLPYFAVPRYLEYLDALPVNAMGRVMKHVLRERGIGDAYDSEKLGVVIAKCKRRG